MTDAMAAVNQIIASDLPAVDKLVQAFARVTDLYLVDGQRELELLQALADREGLVKLQIKLSTIEHCRAILERCYQMIARGRTADGQDEL
jgi:hypothetical protein